MRHEIVLPPRDLLDNFLLNVLVLLAVLEQDVSLGRVLVHRDKTKVVLFTKSLVELLKLSESFISIEYRVELGVDDDYDGSAEDVVVAQILVDRVECTPVRWQWLLGLND